MGGCLVFLHFFWRSSTFGRAGLGGLKRRLSRVVPLRIVHRDSESAVAMSGFGDTSVSIDREVSQRLRAACAAAQITPNALLQGAWALLLGQLQGTDDVVFGMTVAGRPSDIDGIMSLVGFFTNSVPTRVRIDPDASVTAWLRGIRDRQLETQPFEYAQSTDIQAWLGIPGHRPLFESLLVVENFPSQPVSDDSELTLTDYHSGITSRYPLTLAVVPSGCWSLAGHFDRSRFSVAAIDVLLDLFRSLLSELSNAMNAPLNQPMQWLRAATAGNFNLDISPPAITAPVADPRDPTEKYRPPQTPQQRQLATIWEEILGISRIRINDDFFALGGHSLLAIRVFARIEETFGRRLPLEVLFQHGTIARLANLIARTAQPQGIATVLPLHAQGDGRPLFLLPNMGGDLMFSFAGALIDELDGRIPVIAVQPVFPVKDLEPFRDFRTTAAVFVSALRSYQPQGPYPLSGYSYGGLMAFEVACMLSESGEEVDLLALVDSGPGDRGFEPRFGERAQRWSRGLANLPLGLREELRHFSARRVADRIARKLRRAYRVMVSGGRARIKLDDLFDATGEEIQNQALMQVALAALHDYQPARFNGRLTLFRANARPLFRGCPQDLGWGRFVAKLDVYRIDGDHDSILHPPNIGVLVRRLGELLCKRQPSLSTRWSTSHDPQD